MNRALPHAIHCELFEKTGTSYATTKTSNPERSQFDTLFRRLWLGDSTWLAIANLKARSGGNLGNDSHGNNTAMDRRRRFAVYGSNKVRNSQSRCTGSFGRNAGMACDERPRRIRVRNI